MLRQLKRPAAALAVKHLPSSIFIFPRAAALTFTTEMECFQGLSGERCITPSCRKKMS